MNLVTNARTVKDKRSNTFPYKLRAQLYSAPYTVIKITGKYLVYQLPLEP